MRTFEREYEAILGDILVNGDIRQTRNGETKSVFSRHLTIDMEHCQFPVLAGRKIHYKQAFGELAAFLHQPTCAEDFEKFGCTYWDQWADEDGNLELDYGNAWFWEDQLGKAVEAIKNDPNNRRIIVSGWRPDRLEELSLPCCHLFYQWYVHDGQLDIIWYQRSVDMMVGLPYDFVLAAAFNIAMANATDLVAGKITFVLGDCHIYEEHYDDAKWFLSSRKFSYSYPIYTPLFPEGFSIEDFTPDMISLSEYEAPERNLKAKA